jgi:arylsulfatase A-like enzyme
MGNFASVTPDLDKICQEDGVSFRNAFCQNPVCTPSRCSLMSGWYPHVRGHRTMYYMMQPDEPVLLRTLKDEGYFVWWGGKNDLVPSQNSFENYCNVKFDDTKPPKKNLSTSDRWRGEKGSDTYYSHYAGKLTDEDDELYENTDLEVVMGAVDFIANAPQNKPLCLYLPLSFPHPPYGVEDPWFSLIKRSNIPERIPTPENWDLTPSILKGIFEKQGLQSWSEERWTELRATYLGMCSRIDYQFGLLVKALKDADIYDDTAIFVFSDHGDYTGDYGLVEKNQNTFEDCLIRVPFIIKPPSWINVEPRISDALVELVDFSATVEELVGIQPKHTNFGKSLIPLLEGKVQEHRDAVFCEGGRLHGETHCMELESRQDSDGFYWPRISTQRSEGPEHTKAVMIRNKDYKYVNRLYENDELYDLHSDPRELNNLINKREMKNVLSSMKERLLRFFMETGDVVPHTPDKR